jgi:hypothetical protein
MTPERSIGVVDVRSSILNVRFSRLTCSPEAGSIKISAIKSPESECVINETPYTKLRGGYGHNTDDEPKPQGFPG